MARGREEVITRLGLTERLVRTLLLVSAGAFSDGRQAEWLHLEDSCESLLTVFSG